GSFELTNLRVIWGRVAAVRKNLTLEKLAEIFDEFTRLGLLFTWAHNGKRYGHWTGSDVPGRLPPPSWRMRLEGLAPPVPRDQLAAYLARFGGPEDQAELKAGLEPAQAQKWDLNLDWERKKEECGEGSPALACNSSAIETTNPPDGTDHTIEQ